MTNKFNGESYNHAWVEKSGMVFDWQTSMTKPDGVPKEAYDDRVKYVVEGRTILCDYDKVFLCYVSLVEDVNTLDAFLTQCIIQNLAIKLSVPMQLDQVMQNNLIREYNEVILPQARSVDTLENKYWEMEESDFLLSRYNQSPII